MRKLEWDKMLAKQSKSNSYCWRLWCICVHSFWLCFVWYAGVLHCSVDWRGFECVCGSSSYWTTTSQFGVSCLKNGEFDVLRMLNFLTRNWFVVWVSSSTVTVLLCGEQSTVTQKFQGNSVVLQFWWYLGAYGIPTMVIHLIDTRFWRILYELIGLCSYSLSLSAPVWVFRF